MRGPMNAALTTYFGYVHALVDLDLASGGGSVENVHDVGLLLLSR